jgi:hypothetical protein
MPDNPLTPEEKAKITQHTLDMLDDSLRNPQRNPFLLWQRKPKPQSTAPRNRAGRIFDSLKMVLRTLCFGLGLSTLATVFISVSNTAIRPHFTHFVHRWFNSFTSAIGTNNLGFGLLVADAIVVFIFTVAAHVREDGWADMLKDKKKIGLHDLTRAFTVTAILFGPVFLWVGVKTLYEDHQSLVAANSVLRNAPAKIQTITITPEIPKESPTSLRRRTLRLVAELAVFWSHRPAPLQPVQNPSTDEERNRNAASEQFWRDAEIAYMNGNYKDRLLGIVREYRAKGVDTGWLEQSIDQPNRLFGSYPFGGTALDNCLRYQTDFCQFRELAYHVDAQDQPIFLVSK